MAAKPLNIITPSDDLPPQKLKELVLTELKAPTVFKGFIGEKWAEALTWSPHVMSEKLSDVRTRFKVCPKVGTLQHREILSTTDVVYETHCEYVDACFSDFNKWLQTEIEDDDETVCPPPQKIIKSNDKNPFSSVPRSIYWVYADYKYMNELCSDHLDIIDAVDWSVFGFDTRNGLSSTLWIGSEGASTPCHYDTYGCNLVAQLWGTKEWILFSPNDDHKLYPTRVPFEESSVFSRVNIKSPQINKYCDFLKATPYKVVLSPGDVLFVPHHWWHYVECLEPSLSINTWIELASDKEDRITEAIARLLVSNVVTTDNKDSLVNPNEVLFPLEDNLTLLNTILTDGNDEQIITISDFINILTSKEVLRVVKDKVNAFNVS